MSFSSDYVGELGEDIVVNYLRSKGYEVDFTGDRYHEHEIDLVVKRDGVILFYADVKTKQCREEYDDTGFDSADYHKYVAFSKKRGVPVFIYFVDFYRKAVEGNYLHILGEVKEAEFDDRGYFINFDPYPKFEDGVAYFPFNRLEYISSLSNFQIAEIGRFSKKYSGRDYSKFYQILNRLGLNDVEY